jgi:hypothetical protein
MGSKVKIGQKLLAGVFVSTLFGFLVGCSISNSVDNKNETQSTILETPKPSTSAASTESSAKRTPTIVFTTGSDSTPTQTVTCVTTYSFKNFYNYNKQTLHTQQEIKYCNPLGYSLREIPLVFPFISKNETFTLSKLRLDSSETLENLAITENIEYLDLQKELIANQWVNIYIEYDLSIPMKAGTLGQMTNQTNFADWYPFIPPIDFQGNWIIHESSPVGEYLSYDRSDFMMEFSTNALKPFLIASNAIQTLENDTYKFELQNSRNLVFSLNSQFAKIEQDFGSFLVEGYVIDSDSEKGLVTINTIGKSILYFEELFGVPYSHKKITLVEGEFQDGMEYDGLFFLSRYYFDDYNGSFKNYLSLLSIHETAHQWWYGIVGNDQALEPWLDEALATYSEYLYVEEYHEDLRDWWWKYRVYTYGPSGNVAMTIYDQNNLRTYINAVYLNGAQFMQELRGALGDEIFFSRLQTYAEENQARFATTIEFKKSFTPEMNAWQSDLYSKYFLRK